MLKHNVPPARAPYSRETDGGNFGVGFFVGLMSGAIGMFLFGTKQGHSVLRSLRQGVEEKGEELLQPETKQKLIAATAAVKKVTKKTANEWQEKFPKFQRKDISS